MWFDWDGELMRFAHTTKRQKYRNVQINPQVAMSVSDPDDPYRYLELRGDVVPIKPDPTATFFRKIAKRYSRDTPPRCPAPPGARLPTMLRTGWSSWCSRPGSASTSRQNSWAIGNLEKGLFDDRPIST
jgi:PPOX class probable F420-dependent enzyme